jgi:AGCS family alanine or glycine:cation symporter
MLNTFQIPKPITGIATSLVIAAVILGGITRIGKVTSILAPFMAAIYVLGALVVILLNVGELLPSLGLIFREAFNPTAGVAGTGVGAFLVTLMWGVRRGLFSNEAGQGSAPIAHAAAKTDEPVSEGVVALLEPFIDTIVICTMTGLVIIMTGVWDDRLPTEITLGRGDITYVAVGEDGGNETVSAPPELRIVNGVREGGNVSVGWHDTALETLYEDPEMTVPFSGTIDTRSGVATTDEGRTFAALWGMAAESGAPLTQEGFRRGLLPIGDFGGWIVVIAVLLFALSTAISWSYYGDRCANYLFGPNAVLPYKVAFVIMHFIGAVLPLTTIWDLGDIFLAIVIIPNLLALILLAPQVVDETRSYFERRPWIENAAAHHAWKEKQRRGE